MVLEDSGRVDGGGGGIRTPEGLAPLPDFKSGGFNHSPTPPEVHIPENHGGECKPEVRKSLAHPQLPIDGKGRVKHVLWSKASFGRTPGIVTEQSAVFGISQQETQSLGEGF